MELEHAPDHEPPRILLTDDDEVLLHVLPQTIRLRLGEVEILTAASGRDALAVIQTQPLDVVITDLVMPGMNGLTLMDEVVTRHIPPALVLMTAHPYPEGYVTRDGILSFVKKPIEREGFAQTLQRAIRAGRRRRRLLERKSHLDEHRGKGLGFFDYGQRYAMRARQRLKDLRDKLDASHDPRS